MYVITTLGGQLIAKTTFEVITDSYENSAPYFLTSPEDQIYTVLEVN
jgi:hypothetical protein